MQFFCLLFLRWSPIFFAPTTAIYIINASFDSNSGVTTTTTLGPRSAYHMMVALPTTAVLLRDEQLEQRGHVLVATTGGSTKIVKWMLDSLVLLHKVLR